VLIAAEYSDAPVVNNAEFWYDTVLMYCMLRANGFGDEDIFVLYGGGNDGFFVPLDSLEEEEEIESFANNYHGPYCEDQDITGPIVDFPITVKDPPEREDRTQSNAEDIACRTNNDGSTWFCRPREIFRCLAEGCDSSETEEALGCSDCSEIEAMNSSDYLFVWWKGHGTGYSIDKGGFSFHLGSDQVGPDLFRSWLRDIPSNHKLIVVEACHSGLLKGLFDDRDVEQEQARSEVVVASCQANESSWATKLHGTWNGVFSFWMAGTLRDKLPSFAEDLISEADSKIVDPDDNFKPTVSEAFDLTKTAVDLEMEKIQTPLLRDDDPAIAPKTRLELSSPVQDQ